MKLNKKGIEMMHKYEGLRLIAYLCPAKVWTIGYGNTFYEDGSRVKQGDKITKERAYELFTNITNMSFVDPIKKRLLKVELNENQFSALVCFAYNVGIANLSKSTLLRKVNINPNDLTIRNEFIKWNKANGKVLRGLTFRRESEANLYFENIS
jgi:lysozyme